MTTREFVKQNLKPNPNNYLIIDKWNYKYVYLPNRFKLLKEIEEEIDKAIVSSFVNEEFYKRFATIKEIRL